MTDREFIQMLADGKCVTPGTSCPRDDKGNVQDCLKCFEQVARRLADTKPDASSGAVMVSDAELTTVMSVLADAGYTITARQTVDTMHFRLDFSK